MAKYFEDVAAGDVFESPRSVQVTREAIVSFARAWDPQAYHIDDEAAKASFAKGLSASGIHILAISQKLAHEAGFFDISPIAGLGIDGLRILKPVMAGDDLRVRVTITEMRPSKSRSLVGIITSLMELMNQRSEVVLRWQLSELVKMRG